MRKVFGCLTVIAMIFGGYWFVRSWNGVTPWGEGTGSIGHNNKVPVAQKTKSTLQQIADNPTRFKGSRQTVRGRVRNATKIASNRNLYLLVDGDARVLVIDDKAAPQAYYPRAVTGTVQTIGPPIGGLNYAYVTDVKSGVKVNAPRWQDVAKFFTEKYDKVKTGIDEAT